MFHNQAWGTVCDDSWDIEDAEVVCRRLGCGKVLSVESDALFLEGSGPIWLDNVNCTGEEIHLKDCEHDGMGSHNCGHDEDASVICEGKCAF